MARYRNVSTSFWEDNKVVDDFTPEDKYIYLYLPPDAIWEGISNEQG